jgi:VanZ family protein
LSLTPGTGLPRLQVPHADKVAHAGMYAVQMFLLRRAMGIHRCLTRKAASALLICCGYGLLMEHAQLLFHTAGRTFSWGDVAANSLGAISVMVVTGGLRAIGTSRTQAAQIREVEKQ